MITYRLYRCVAKDGLVDLVLHLYRDQDLACVTTITRAAPRLAVRIFMEARAHLRSRGIPEGAPVPLQAA